MFVMSIFFVFDKMEIFFKVEIKSDKNKIYELK